MNDLIRRKILETALNLQRLAGNEGYLKSIALASESIVEAMRAGNKLLICGNGGSAADAHHIAGEFLCRFYIDRSPMPAIALPSDTSVLTSIGNDYSFDDVFSRQVRGLGKRGDVMLGISTSGGSRNVVRAFEAAREMGIKTILLTGDREKEIAALSDIVVMTPSSDTPRIQEMHLVIEHIICEIVENSVCR